MGFLGLFSIITNCWLLGYTSNVIRDMSGSANTLQVVVILEHCLLITKLWIAAAVPDMPRDVARALTKQDLVRKNAQDGLHEEPNMSDEEAEGDSASDVASDG